MNSYFLNKKKKKQPHQITIGGSVRIKTCDLELPQLLSIQPSSSSTNSPNTNTPTQHGNVIEAESGRAVDNQYSFV